MKETQLDTGIAKQIRQGFLRAIERPRRREDSGILARVGVADHHFLAALPRIELKRVDRIVEERTHHEWRVLEIVESLEERDDVNARARRLGGKIDETRFAREHENRSEERRVGKGSRSRGGH